MTYDEFIDKLNGGGIVKMRFCVIDYNHYRNCNLNCRYDEVALPNAELKSLFIEVQLTNDRSEYHCFCNRFDDRHRIFKINKIKYTFKDIWNRIEILELIENS